MLEEKKKEALLDERLKVVAQKLKEITVAYERLKKNLEKNEDQKVIGQPFVMLVAAIMPF